jgi:ATP-binding cassette subfamily B protein IrtB
VCGVVARAVGVVVLVPLVQELFSDRPAGAWIWVGVLVLVTALGWALDTVTARIGYGLGFDLLNSGQQTIAQRLTRIRLSWFTGDNTIDARQAIAATGPDLTRLIAYLVTPILGAVLLPIALALALLPISAPLGLAALAGVPLLLGAYAASGWLTRTADARVQQADGVLTQRILEFARTQQALRAARRVEPARSSAGAALTAQHGAMMRLILLQIPGEILFGLASQLALLLLAGTTVVLTARGGLEVTQAIALIVVIVRYLEPFQALSDLAPAVETTTGMLRRIRAVLDAPVDPSGTRSDVGAVVDPSRTNSPVETAPDNGASDAEAPGLAGPTANAPAPRLELRDVAFAYRSSEDPVLSDLSLTLEPGTTTAIVGPSGSGKSTVLQLLAGLRQPTRGAVMIDGTDLSELTPEARRAQVSVVFQEPYLFDDSVAANVRVGDPEAGDEDLARVARLARVDTVVDRLPDGWDTRVGEAGTSLSGGERQRVSIARALLKPAPVLLVDEATSALDAENGRAVISALGDDPVARTRVIVAHQLESIRSADRVIFLERGRIVEDGTVEGLLAAGGRFARFWQQQSDAADWRLGQPN